MIHIFLKFAFVTLLTSLLLVTGCKKTQPSIANKDAQDSNLVMANASLLAQITVSEVAQSDVSDILRVAGQIDFDEQFEKSILSPINSIIAPLGLPEITKRLSVVMDIFGGYL